MQNTNRDYSPSPSSEDSHEISVEKQNQRVIALGWWVKRQLIH
jgi:hypothetical protein